MIQKFKQVSYLLFLTTLLISCNRQQFPTSYSTNTTAVDDSINADAEIEAMIAPYKVDLDDQMDAVLLNLSDDMYKDRPQGELGNFMTDAVQEYLTKYNVIKYDADFTLLNNGGIRVQKINKGELTVGEIYELMPFDNEIVVLELSGTELMKLFQRITDDNGWPLSKEVQLVMKGDKIQSLKIDGKEVDKVETYHIFVSDYNANGGDGLDLFIDLEREVTGLKLRDILINYCVIKSTEMSTLTIEKDQRVIQLETETN